MKRINLLHERKSDEWAFGGDTRLRLLGLAGWTSVLIWAGVAMLHVRSVGAEAARREETVARLQADSKRLQDLRADEDQLLKQADWLDRVATTIPGETVMGLIAEALPKDVALTTFSLALRSTSGQARQTESDGGRHDEFIVRLGGVATDTLVQAALLRSLETLPWLQEVRLMESGAAEGGSSAARRFIVTATIGLAAVRTTAAETDR